MTLKSTIDNHIPWKEQLDLLQVYAISDEYGWDEWLETFEENGSGVFSARRVSTPLPNFHRHENNVIKRANTNWDKEFSAAQSHVKDVLINLGNA